ncbi:MAG: hypothetical protein IKB05_03310 [Alphaproteobacteria bacterium]|nr:hypothetical protein [Alphaproteobacteria bacterium]
MKKILTVSLVAMMAVSAARADIASTAYVDGAVGAEESSREAAINAVNTKIGNVATGKTVVTMISEAQTAAEAKVTALENGQVKTNKEAIESINAELGSMASDATVQGIQTALTTLQGTVTSNKTAADKTQTDLDTAEGKIATLEATVAGHTEDINGINTALEGKQGTISDLATIRSGAAAGATAVQSVTTGTNNGTILVDGDSVAVKGLGSAAYTDSGAYAAKSYEARVATAESDITALENRMVNSINGVSDQEAVVPSYAFMVDTINDMQSDLGTDVGTIQATLETYGDIVTHNASEFASAAQGAEAASAVQQSEVTTGSANGTIAVQGKDVAVKGLGSAAYTASSTYATAAQGTAADTAKRVTDLISAGTTGSDGTYVLTATVSNNTVTGYKWELIDRAY